MFIDHQKRFGQFFGTQLIFVCVFIYTIISRHSPLPYTQSSMVEWFVPWLMYQLTESKRLPNHPSFTQRSSIDSDTNLSEAGYY